jgi:hypothetical protein
MSQYYTIATFETTGTTKYQTLALTTGQVSTSTAITARRILITNGTAAAYVAFGTNPVTSTTAGFLIPANNSMIFNFRSGDKVAAVAGAGSGISILDLD